MAHEVLTRFAAFLRGHHAISSVASVNPDPDLESCPQPARPDQSGREFIPLRGHEKEFDENAQIQLYVLCAKCKALKEVIEKRLKRWHYDDDSANTIALAHHHSLGQLRDSSQRGCHLCSVVWQSLVVAPGANPLMSDTGWDENELRDIPFTLERSPKEPWYHVVIEVRVPPFDMATSIKITDIKFRGAQYPTTKVSAVSTKAEICRSFYKERLRICNETHTTCHLKRVRHQPTRLLHLAPDPSGTPNAPPSVKLVVSGDEWFDPTRDKPEYAALSYCWGTQKEESLQLKKSNYESLKENIPYDDLPATIQDSIIVTLDLGLQYLWVDALCIMQDSKDDDWPREAEKMYDIYQGCSVALAASGASDSSEGLFAVRDPLRQTACVLKTVYTKVQEGREERDKDWILETRGWAFQERILPSRLIQFGSYLNWECREISIDEFGRSKTHDVSTLPGVFYSRVLEPGGMFEGSEILKLWRHIFEEYQKAKLSVKSDRLAAIRGLSSAIEQRTGWTYIYGLWEPFIIQQLLWLSPEGTTESTGLRPSWSWASRDGDVWTPLLPKSSRAVAKYIGISPSVSWGLELSGILCRTRERGILGERYQYLRVEGWPDTVVIEVTYDDKGRRWTEGDMILPLIHTGYSTPDVKGLLVVPSMDSQAFERVGYFFAYDTRDEDGFLYRRMQHVQRSLSESGTEPFIRQNILLV